MERVALAILTEAQVMWQGSWEMSTTYSFDEICTNARLLSYTTAEKECSVVCKIVCIEHIHRDMCTSSGEGVPRIYTDR